MRRTLSLLALLLAGLLLVTGATHAQNPQEPERPNDEPGDNEEQMSRSDLGNVSQSAMGSYHAGRREVAKAEKLEAKLAETDPAKIEKARAKVQKAYESAAASFLEAIRTKPDLTEAYAALGPVYGTLGKHAEAVQVYNAALKLDPENVEYVYGRAESFLALNYLREAATAYTEMLPAHQEHAAKLMVSLKQWVSDHRQEPGEIRPEAVETLAAWIAQQEAGSG